MKKKAIIDWNPTSDPVLKKGEVEVHHKIHTQMHEKDMFNEKPARIKLLMQGEKFTGTVMEGSVLDIGCGNGYSSINLLKNRKGINMMHSMECNLPAVDQLIRTNYTRNKIDPKRYELILGSFNNIRNKNFYNYITALGVIHHSGNLLKTMKSIYSALKPGGFFIAHEPYMKSFTPNSVYIKKEDNIKKVQGMVTMKESERDDHFFRQCEYLTAFHHSGFDIVKFHKVGSKGNIQNAVMVLQKPVNPPKKVPHSWL